MHSAVRSALAVLVRPATRNRPLAVLRRVAMTWGVAAALGDCLGGVALAVQRVCGDDRACEVQGLSTTFAGRDFAGLLTNSILGEHRGGALAQPGQQMG